MPSGLLHDADYWRARAEEMRALAWDAEDRDCKQIMLRLAEDDDQLAKRADPRDEAKFRQFLDLSKAPNDE